MKWATTGLLFFMLACKTKGPPCFIDVSDILKGSPLKLISVKDSGYKVISLADIGWDSLKGGVYVFYPNELLKSYTFYQNKTPVYTEEYDDHGYLANTKGSPMVARIINELGDDSAYVQVYFFKPKKTYRHLNIKINQRTNISYDLTMDTVYSNLLSVTFGINTSEMNRLSMYSQISYVDDCTQVEHVLSDSLFLIKDSKNGLTPVSAK
jgi:hypothetical protein